MTDEEEDLAPYADREIYEAATALIEVFGDTADFEAASRAEHSRNLGNLIHFCRWRQVERLIFTLASREVSGSRH